MVLADARSLATDAYRQMWDQRIAAIEKEGGRDRFVAGARSAIWLTDEIPHGQRGSDGRLRRDDRGDQCQGLHRKLPCPARARTTSRTSTR